MRAVSDYSHYKANVDRRDVSTAFLGFASFFYEIVYILLRIPEDALFEGELVPNWIPVAAG